MEFEEQKIEEALTKAFENLELESEVVHDAVFHMTDWLDDLKAWTAFCENPESINSEALGELAVSFLVHVPAHVAAASKLVTGLPVSDVFGIGATTEEAS